MAIERLDGYSVLSNKLRRIQVNSTLQVYDDGDRAGLIVGAVGDPSIPGEDISFRDPTWIHGIRVFIAVLHEVGGYGFVEPAEDTRQRRLKSMTCPYCNGSGQQPDRFGNWADCPACNGE